MKNQYVIGLDIGGTNLRIGAVNEDMELFGFTKQRKNDVFCSDNAPQDLLDFIKNYLLSHPEFEHISAISMGFPSAVNKERTKLISTPHIKGIDNIDIKAMFENELNVPVFLDKDVAMHLLYDMYYHKVPNDGIIIGCYIGTGIGNIISIDGKFIIGKDGVACELGHIPVPGKDEICVCGNVGCIENYASGNYLKTLADNEADIPNIFTHLPLSDKVIQFIDYLSVPIAAEINILNPDAIFLGGGVLFMKDFPIKLLEERIRARCRKPFPCENLSIYYSVDSGDTGIIGASIYARRELL